MNNAKLCYWYFELTLYFLIWNWMELTTSLSSLFIHVQNLSSLCLFQGDMPDGMHKSAEGWETNPTYIAAKKAKHLEDSETTPKSCLDVVFKLLETRRQTSSHNSLLNQVDFFSPKCWCQNRQISGRGSRTMRLRIDGNRRQGTWCFTQVRAL